ncbi:MAG: cytochrome c-type biogenesis protein CcmH [Rhodobacteraceae bacterium]|nr:cytochrome c-type biogenesis protein CcmH [Paracoccaceae bacterium]
MKRIILPLFLLASPVAAVQPGEILDNPVLEARARALSKNLRCLVCRNENIDSSDAQVAADLRMLVRERLMAGDTDQQVLDHIVARYGEFVLLRPTWSRGNAILWLTGPLALGAGLFLVTSLVCSSRRRTGGQPLSRDEATRLAELTRDD